MVEMRAFMPAMPYTAGVFTYIPVACSNNAIRSVEISRSRVDQHLRNTNNTMGVEM